MIYEKSFKEEAVKLSNEVGIRQASTQLGIKYNTLVSWRGKQKKYGKAAHVGSGRLQLSDNELENRIRELEKTNAELEKANEILKDALGFFAKDRKK